MLKNASDLFCSSLGCIVATVKEIIRPNDRETLRWKHNVLIFYVTRKALMATPNLTFNLSNSVSACASGAAGMEIWRLRGREGQDPPPAPELQIPDREGAECQMQNVFMFYFLFFFDEDYHPRGS